MYLIFYHRVKCIPINFQHMLGGIRPTKMCKPSSSMRTPRQTNMTNSSRISVGYYLRTENSDSLPRPNLGERVLGLHL